MSDDALGLFLSGGLDSSALAGLMSRMVRQRPRTFSVGLLDADRTSSIRTAGGARGRLGAPRVVVTPGEFFDALPRLIRHEDEPIAFVERAALLRLAPRRRGRQVMLTGEAPTGCSSAIGTGSRTGTTASAGSTGAGTVGAAPDDRPIAPGACRGCSGRGADVPGARARPAAALLRGLRGLPDRAPAGSSRRPGLLAARDPYETALERYAAARAATSTG
jgi:hypothetical protein